jgi:signal transduction histidine kinase
LPIASSFDPGTPDPRSGGPRGTRIRPAGLASWREHRELFEGWWCRAWRHLGETDPDYARDETAAPVRGDGPLESDPAWARWSGGPARGYPRPGLSHHGRWWSGPRRSGPLRRTLDGRLVGGVASGVSERFGVDTTVVRGAFVLSTLIGGVGIAAYVLAWLFIPVAGEDSSAASRAVSDLRGIALALALVPVLALTLLVASLVGAGWLTTISWPLFIAAGGLVLVWRNVGPEERLLLDQAVAPVALIGTKRRRSKRELTLRAFSGVVLAGVGVGLLVRGHHPHGLVASALGVLFIVASVVVLFSPWWLHVARELVDERQARVRAEERADMAARLHDSVMQTLALIQRHAADPHEVVKLARSQERELRSWLFEGRVPGATGEDDATMGAAVERIQREVEALHGVPVEAVVVGDCELDDDLRSLVEAGREATVNAAKWSEASAVSLFVEVEPERVALYVRDRGRGFDEADVAPDRRGLSESIRGRMTRHGGSASIRSQPGEGTEVTLTMARH